MSGIRRRVADVLGPGRQPYAWVDDTARAAARRMLKGGVDALPVLGERGDLVGIVTASELLPLFWPLARTRSPSDPWMISP